MRKIVIFLILLTVIFIPVQALDISAPTAPSEARELMPEAPADFGSDLWYILKNTLKVIRPDIIDSITICAGLIGIVLLVSIIKSYLGATERIAEFVATIGISILLIKPANSFIHLGVETIQNLSEYGKLLLPVMTAAMAAEGGITTATGLYSGTIIFNTVLTTALTKLMIPMVYVFMTLAVADSAVGENVLQKLKEFLKWLMTWCLKILLYLFTGYLSITGVVSGKVDASSVKAAKIAVSGFVPVVGSVMSDASEAILISAGVVKNAAGIYGILAIIAICVIPFAKIGVQYLLLKLCGAVCGVFGSKASVKLIEDFTALMGLLLAMTGCVCVLHLVSTVCFMKGFG
jgi:stage III sporulation protein AE